MLQNMILIPSPIQTCFWVALLRSLAAGMLFGWETVMTFVLVSVVYAVAVGEPSFGNIGPFAVGLSLFSMVFAGKHLLGCC